MAHIIICSYEAAWEVYRALYRTCKRGGVGGTAKKLIFPKEIVDIVRSRFGLKGTEEEDDKTHASDPNVSSICVHSL